MRLGSVCEFSYGKSLPEIKRMEGDYPVLGSNGRIGFHNKYLLESPSIIIGRKGCVGKVNWEEKKCTPIDTTFYIKLLSSEIKIKFLFYILKELKLHSLKGGAGVPGLNRNEAYSYKIPLPPEEVQNKIILELDYVEKKE